MAFKLPRPNWAQAIVDKGGKATREFSRRIEDAFTKIETQETNQDALIAEQAAQAAEQAAQQAQIVSILSNLGYLISATGIAQQSANNAQTTADSAGGGTARSASTTASGIVLSGTGWVEGGAVALNTVSAGNLTITGSGTISGNVSGTMFGEYRIVEVAGGTTIFTGQFTTEGAITTNESVDAVAAFTLAETTTGTVQYRIDARRVNGASPASIDLYLYVRRS